MHPTLHSIDAYDVAHTMCFSRGLLACYALKQCSKCKFSHPQDPAAYVDWSLKQQDAGRASFEVKMHGNEVALEVAR